MIKMNEKLTALFIGILWFHNCGKHFRSSEGENSRTRIGSSISAKEAIKPGSNVLMKIRAIQGLTGGNLIAPELMGHVAGRHK